MEYWLIFQKSFPVVMYFSLVQNGPKHIRLDPPSIHPPYTHLSPTPNIHHIPSNTSISNLHPSRISYRGGLPVNSCNLGSLLFPQGGKQDGNLHWHRFTDFRSWVSHLLMINSCTDHRQALAGIPGQGCSAGITIPRDGCPSSWEWRSGCQRREWVTLCGFEYYYQDSMYS